MTSVQGLERFADAAPRGGAERIDLGEVFTDQQAAHVARTVHPAPERVKTNDEREKDSAAVL